MSIVITFSYFEGKKYFFAVVDGIAGDFATNLDVAVGDGYRTSKGLFVTQMTEAAGLAEAEIRRQVQADKNFERFPPAVLIQEIGEAAIWDVSAEGNAVYVGTISGEWSGDISRDEEEVSKALSSTSGSPRQPR